MTDVKNPGPAWTGRLRHGSAIVIAMAAVLLFTGVATAKITIRRHTLHDNFFFHGNYSTTPFDPETGFGLEIWNCADGAMPTFLSGRVPLVICAFDPGGDHTLAELVYAVGVPAGDCIDHGASCYYRNARVPSAGAGVRYLRVRYARHGRGNRVWLESFGDLSAAQQARMLIVITIDGLPRAILQDTFTPLPNGGWFSPF